MRSIRVPSCVAGLLALGGGWALADGAMFLPRIIAESGAVNLAQTRQEVVLAIHPYGASLPTEAGNTQTAVTYVLRTYYRGDPGDYAWVIPVPGTPTDIVAHADARLFERLALITSPRFTIVEPPAETGGCGCATPTGGARLGEGALVEVEASGTAGVFDWAVLTSGGSDALLGWLNENDFKVPDEAASILDVYVAQDMHFLAVRINAPEQLATDATGAIDIPPLQFTAAGSRRFYPMAISRITAADPTEVLIYLMGNYRMEVANLPNGVIDPNELVYQPNSVSLTNYEALFTGTLTRLGGAALITEYAGGQYGLFSTDLFNVWPDAPVGTESLSYLTRLRTVLPRSRMDRDFEFQEAATDDGVYPQYYITVEETATASLLGQSAVVAAGYGLFCRFVKRAARQRRRDVAARTQA
jgi:hypothetical protein